MHLFVIAVVIALFVVFNWLIYLGGKVAELTQAITDLNAAITALQGRVAGAVPVAQVQAAAAQIEAAVTTLNSIS